MTAAGSSCIMHQFSAVHERSVFAVHPAEDDD